MRIIGEPKRAGIETIYKADDLTILNICWGPRMEFKQRRDQVAASYVMLATLFS